MGARQYLRQVQPDADFIPAASRALYTLPRPMFNVVATSVTERPALKSFTASSALSRADGLRPDDRLALLAALRAVEGD